MTGAVDRAPACSVVIPTFDRAPLLGEAIESVLAQSRDDWELLVVDDGSTDETASVLARYGDPRIRFVREPHRGRSTARNRGVELAGSDLIGFLDSDDRLLPHALDTHLRAYSAAPSLGMTIAGYERIDARGGVLGVREPWQERGELSLGGWLLNCFGIPSAVMVRKSWLKRVGGFRTDFEPAEDWDLFVRLAVAGCPMTWVLESVCQYREHEGNSVRAPGDHLDAALSMLSACADDPRFPGDLRALMPRARAWACANSACTAAGLGETEHVRRALGAAREAVGAASRRRVSSSAPPDGFESVLEPLVGALVARSERQADVTRVAKSWGLSERELRRAWALVEMSAFFAAVEKGDRADAGGHLRRGLRRDPRWLIHRGVAGFLLGRRRSPAR